MIQDIHADIGTRGRTDYKDLVAADAPPPVGKRARRRFGHRNRTAAAPVENDEIISKAVHFQEISHGQPNTPNGGE